MDLDKSYQQANQLFYHNRLRDALVVLEEILEQDPSHALALNKIGVIYIHAGEREKARDFFQRAIDADGDCAPALGNKAALLLEDGDEEQAYELFQRAASLEQDNPYILNNLATFHKRRGEMEQYLSLYKKSQRLLRDKVKHETREDFRNMRQRSGCGGATALLLAVVAIGVAIVWLI